jgi:hypothetical protein
LRNSQSRSASFFGGGISNVASGQGASVSGLYFAHPEARYFALGKIDPVLHACLYVVHEQLWFELSDQM